jgi:PAS domain S-box-containing protein
LIEQEVLHRALERQKKARKIAEQILESKSLELYNITQELKTANSKLEHHLDEKKSELKGVFENINDAYIVMNLAGNVLKMNDVAETFFGYKLLQDNLNVTDLVYSEDYTYAMNSYTELVKSGHFYDYTARIITKKKEIKWVNINASIIYDKSNKAIAAQGIVRDITIQREKRLTLDLINNTAKSILGKEEINEIAFEISNSIANYLSTNDCVIYLIDQKTNNLERIASYNKGKFNEDIISLASENKIIEEVSKTGHFEIIYDTSKDQRYKKGTQKMKSKITVPIVNNGIVIGVIDAEHENKNYFRKEHVITIQTIANLVALQLKSALNLRERKKIEIKNDELLKKLEKSNQELEEYAHIVSHDLKSPLRSIAALTSWIKTDNIEAFDEASLQNFEALDLTLETMENLISDVLKYSSLNTIVSEDTPVDLDSLIKKLVNVLYVPKNININFLNKLPIIKGDKTKFQQLFQNLIGNAIKFSDKEVGFINIDVEDHNSFYKFTIEDNGIGIDKKHFESIFKIFQSLKKAKNSSGIGLSIVKKIVDIYNGEVWLESDIGKGTTFYFTIKK